VGGVRSGSNGPSRMDSRHDPRRAGQVEAAAAEASHRHLPLWLVTPGSEPTSRRSGSPWHPVADPVGPARPGSWPGLSRRYPELEVIAKLHTGELSDFFVTGVEVKHLGGGSRRRWLMGRKTYRRQGGRSAIGGRPRPAGGRASGAETGADLEPSAPRTTAVLERGQPGAANAPVTVPLCWPDVRSRRRTRTRIGRWTRSVGRSS
jgi:hypothetical protein